MTLGGERPHDAFHGDEVPDRGVLQTLLAAERHGGRSVHASHLRFRGVPFMDEADDMIEDLKDVVDRSIADLAKKVQNAEGVQEAELREKLHGDPAATAGTQIAIQTLWGGPWFRDVAGLDRCCMLKFLRQYDGAFHRHACA